MKPRDQRSEQFIGFVTREDQARAYQQAANTRAKGNKSRWIKDVLDREASKILNRCEPSSLTS